MIRKQTYRQAHRCLLLWKSKVGDGDQKVIKELLIYNFREIKIFQFSSIQFSPSVVSDSWQPHGTPDFPVHHQLPVVYSNSCPLSWRCHPATSSLSSSAPPAPNPSQHQGLFQWVKSSHKVAKVLEFQL